MRPSLQLVALTLSACLPAMTGSAIAQAYRTLPAVWRRLEDHRRHRRASSPSNAIFSSREIFNRGPVGTAVVETVRITLHEYRRCG